MASNRFISTNFWKDTYVIDLDPIEKILFLYLLTNPNTNIAGIYEISLRQIAFDTGIDKDMVAKILERFERDKKLQYRNGWMALNNWIKHQSINPKVALGIERIIDDLPEWLRNELLEPDDPQLSLLNDNKKEPIHSLSKPIALNLTKLNLTKPNGNSKEFEKSKTLNKKTYAMAVARDRDLEVRATSRKANDGNGFQKAKAVRDVIARKQKG